MKANRRSRSLIQANRRSDTHPRFRKHVLGLRLSATPSDHAFRPRLSHAFRPRLSATLSGHVFQRAIRVEDVLLLLQQSFKQTNHCRTLSYWTWLTAYNRCSPSHCESQIGDHHEHSKTIIVISSSTCVPGCQYSELHNAGGMTSERNPRDHRNCSQKSLKYNEVLPSHAQRPFKLGLTILLN